jgi:uncharacterized membrane protein YbhN (UPF0104 family)
VATIAASMGVVALLDGVIGLGAIGALSATGQLPSPPGLPATPAPAEVVVAHPVAAVAGAVALLAAVAVAGHRLRPRLAQVWTRLKAGTAILATPRRYATEVVPLQLSAWACRIGAAFFLLGAFGVPATVPAAVIVVVAGGLSTLVPTPGGVGTQQLFVAYFLHATASTATLVAFSLGMQATITTVNILVGLTATALLFRTLWPERGFRAQVRSVRAEIRTVRSTRR